MIPNWTINGVIPPIRPGLAGTTPDRSPYLADISEVIDRFALSKQRTDILCGLLKYRAALYSAGLLHGFQWLNGSFLQDVETIESRSPKDVDVVTFYCLPDGETQHSLLTKHSHLFDHANIKHLYRVDAYQVTLGTLLASYTIREISYWYSMWAHRRDGLWKGFVQIDLDPVNDAAAISMVDAILSDQVIYEQ